MMIGFSRFLIPLYIQFICLADARILLFTEDLIPSYLKAKQLLMPGTKWCGDGNRAKDYNDLGYFHKTDICCREHDHCPYTILKGDQKYGLENPSFYTRSHCECDQKFYKCLKESGHYMSNRIGYLYFTILHPRCFTFTQSCNSTSSSENSIDCNIVNAEWKDNQAF